MVTVTGRLATFHFKCVWWLSQKSTSFLIHATSTQDFRVYESWQIDICRPCIVLHRVSGCRTHQNRNSPVNHMGIGYHPPGKCWERLRWWQSWVSGSFHSCHPKTSFEAQQSWPKKWKAKLMSLMSYPVMSHLDQSSRWHPIKACHQAKTLSRWRIVDLKWVKISRSALSGNTCINLDV